jgi:hypothetical protein
MERQKQGVVTYQLEFDIDTVAELACPHGEVTGASPEAKPMREQQVFAAWKESTLQDHIAKCGL